MKFWMSKGYSKDKFNESAFLSMSSIIGCQLLFDDYILPPCFVVIFWLFNTKSNCTVFPLFFSLNVGFVSLSRVQYSPSTSGANIPVFVLTTSAVLISIGDCLLPWHFWLKPPQFAGPNKTKHLNVFTWRNFNFCELKCTEVVKASISNGDVLRKNSAWTYLFPMHPFSTPWKYQKTLRFSDVFRG